MQTFIFLFIWMTVCTFIAWLGAAALNVSFFVSFILTAGALIVSDALGRGRMTRRRKPLDRRHVADETPSEGDY